MPVISRVIITIYLACLPGLLPAQADSLPGLQNISSKYLLAVSSKADKYYNRTSSKTEKTLEKLARWENKIKSLLEKLNPETASRLFGEGQLTFSMLLQKYKEGKATADGYRANYDEYRDKLTTSLKYLDNKKEALNKNAVQPLKEAKEKIAQLNDQLDGAEAVQRFIKERKRLLIQQTVQYIGQSKHLKRISKESYYFAETLTNYKKLFSEPGRAERTALQLLDKIPAFKEFMRKNSMLASLFRIPDPNDPLGTANLAGLQTRASVNNLIQQQIAAGGPNAMIQFRQNLQDAQAQLNQLKDKLIKASPFGGGLEGAASDAEMPDEFLKSINSSRAKTFWQKWELGMNLQNNRATALLPVSSNLGISAGFRPHDKFVIGIGMAGRIAWGRDIRHIAIRYSGISARSFAELKLKGSFHATAGFEMNYRSEIKNIEQLKDKSGWQQSMLVGLGKVVSLKTKFFKKTKLQLLFDCLSQRQVPRAQTIQFRFGYSF